jgi:inner membrane protein
LAGTLGSGLAGGVEWIAHIALGALIGEAVLGSKLGRLSLLWGALAALLPELDGFFALFFAQSTQLWVERGILHSVPVLALLVPLLARSLAQQWQRHAKVEPGLAALFLLLIWAAHLSLDVLGSLGAGLLEPFSHQRFALNLLPEGNLVISIPLVIGLLRMCLVSPKVRETGSHRRMLGICLILPLVVCALCFLGKTVTASDLEKDLQRRAIIPRRVLLTPVGHLPILWRCFIDRGESLELGYHCVWERPDDPIQWSALPRGLAIFRKYADQPEVLHAAMASQDWWLARPSGAGIWLADFSQPEWRSRDSRGTALRPKRSWVFLPKARLDRLKPIQLPEQFQQDFSYLTSRMWDREAWSQSADRLVGNPGVIQEFLPIKTVPRR